jgi:hypothetical protein
MKQNIQNKQNNTNNINKDINKVIKDEEHNSNLSYLKRNKRYEADKIDVKKAENTIQNFLQKIYSQRLFSSLLQKIKHKFIDGRILNDREKQEYDLMSVEEYNELLKTITPEEKKDIRFIFNGDIGDSDAYLVYFSSYKKMSDKLFEKNKNDNKNISFEELFQLSQTAFSLPITKFKSMILTCKIKKEYLHNIISKRLLEFSVNSSLNISTVTKDLPDEITCQIEFLVFRDNSVIVKLLFREDQNTTQVTQVTQFLQKYFDEIQKYKDEFFEFLDKNDYMITNLLFAYQNNSTSSEVELFKAQREEMLKMAKDNYLNSYFMLLESLKNGIFIEITDLDKLLSNISNYSGISDLKSFSFSSNGRLGSTIVKKQGRNNGNKNINFNIQSKQDVIDYIKNKQMFITIHKKATKYEHK